MSYYFTFWEKKDTQREYEYFKSGKTFTQLENEVECIFCYDSGKDMVGQHMTGGNRGICLDCFKKLKKQEKELNQAKILASEKKCR